MTDQWGIDDRYFDALGVEHVTSRETHAALLAAMGLRPSPPARRRPRRPKTGSARAARRTARACPPIDDDVHGRVKVVRAGESPFIAAPGRLTLEDGTVLGVERALPPDLPIGYHRLAPRTGHDQTLVIVTPGACHLPDDLRTWGWAAQIYAARSRASWGIGDFADLRRLGPWSREALGAGVIMVNPFTAPTPVRPSSRRPTTRAAGAFATRCTCASKRCPAPPSALGAHLARLAEAGHALNRGAAHRSRRDLRAEDGGAGADLRSVHRRRRLRRFLERAGRRADPVRDLLRAGRAPRQGLAALAARIPAPRRRRGRALRHATRRAACASTPGCSG